MSNREVQNVSERFLGICKRFKRRFSGAHVSIVNKVSSVPLQEWQQNFFGTTGWAGRFGFAFAASGAIVWFSLGFGRELGTGVFPFLFPVTFLTAWIGGRFCGALTTIVLALGTAYYHLPPVGFEVSDPGQIFSLCAFLLSGLLVSGLVGMLQQNVDLMNCTLQSIGEGVITTDRQTRTRALNPVAEALTGWPKNEAVGKPLEEVLRIVTATTGQSVGTLAALAMQERRVVALPDDSALVSRSGDACPIDNSVAPIQSRMGDVLGAVVVFRDVTKRKQAEAALIEAETRSREIFENAVVGMFQSTPDGRYVRVNRAMAVMHGYDSPQEMIEAITDIAKQEWVDPLLRDEFRHLLEKEQIVRAFPMEARRRDGTIMSTIANARVVRDAHGNVLYYEGTQEDVTERKSLRAQLEHAQKMEAVGRLAGGVAHDFNNILGVISGYADLAKEKVATDHPVVCNITKIKEAALRAARLTRQLLTFSRQQVLQPTVLDLNKTISGVSQMLASMVGEDVTIAFKPGEGLGLVVADPGQIEQILMNLAVNARDAMPLGGEIRIETGNVNLDKEYVRQHRSATPGPHVMLSFTDTGQGIAKNVLPHIFEPFFTTKEPGKGTGLGLATVYGIVKQSNGNIWVYSEPGLGTTFRIYFPRVDLRETPSAIESQAAVKGGIETILLMEDDADIREVVSAMLEKAGYKVLKPETTTVALEMAQGIPETIDLLLTDVIMPYMSGVELYDQVRASRPHIKRLYMTGYAGGETSRLGLLESQAVVIEKPFEAHALLASVRAILDREDS